MTHHPLGWPERPRAGSGTGSQFDSVMLDMPIEDAERVVDALNCRVAAAAALKNAPECDALSFIAGYITVQINVAKNLAAKRNADPQAGGYMQFDMSQDAAAAAQEMK